jgi:TolB-like protein
VTIAGPGTAVITAYQTGNNNYLPTEPVKQVLIVRGQKPRIVVMPMDNLSGKRAPLKEIRQRIIEGLTRQGAVVLDDGAMQKFMVRHRVRYVGGVDTVTAKAWKKEEGMEAVLISSLDQYDDVNPPKIAVTARLVSTGDMPYILWMENIGLSGDDSYGLFGAGLVEVIGPVQEKAVKQILDEVAGYYADRAVPGNDGPDGTYLPKVLHRSRFLEPGKQYTVAVLSFFNKTKNSKADEIIALRFVSQLAKSGDFDVLEPGVVRQKLLNFRVIMRDGIAKADAEGFFNQLETDLILAGTVLEYQEGNLKMEFDVQVLERKSRSDVWKSWSYNAGNDGIVFFDRGRVNNAGVLASKMVKTVVRNMTVW